MNTQITPASETRRGAYAHTPHVSIQELCERAAIRVRAGEAPYHVRQDIVNGFSLGWFSANDSLIYAAINQAIPQR